MYVPVEATQEYYLNAVVPFILFPGKMGKVSSPDNKTQAYT